MINNSLQTDSPALSRRNFLKTSATATAAAATLGSLEIARYAHAAGNDIIKLGMIGSGGRCTGAAGQALRADPGTRLVAMCDILKSRITTARKAISDELDRLKRPEQVQVPEERRFTGFDAYKKVIECSDAVLIANAAKFHPFHAMAALQAGKHVFVEKPHGIDPAGIKLMKAAGELAKEKKLCLVSGLHSRYHTGYQELIKRVHDGAIGDIVSIEENFLRPPYGVVDRDPGLSELEWQCSTQYHFIWLSGDDVVQSLVHNLDRASWALKEAVPVKCHGLGGRSSMTDGLYGNVFDHHTVVYEYASGVRIYALCRTTTGCYNEYSSLIFGTKGKADVMACRIMGENKWRGDANCDAHYQEQVEYMKALRAGTPINNCDYMARSTLIGIMGQLSCYTGKEITWEKINSSDFAFKPLPADCHDGMEPPVKPGPNGSYTAYVPGKTTLI
jgi:myo-inositol 2-dehydrogenase / D-chiro-inositol 1-dehydrogenase